MKEIKSYKDLVKGLSMSIKGVNEIIRTSRNMGGLEDYIIELMGERDYIGDLLCKFLTGDFGAYEIYKAKELIKEYGDIVDN